MNQQPKTVQTIILIAILALVLVVISSSLLTQNSSRLAYSDVLDLFENERVESFVLQGDTLTMTLYASDTAQAGTAAARIGDIETFHKDLDETIAAQSASGILKSYNYLPAANSIWRSVLPLSDRRHCTAVCLVHSDEPLRRQSECHGAVYTRKRPLRRSEWRSRYLQGRCRRG